MVIERTFVMVKPDGVARGLVGDIITRFEKKGFKLVAMRMLRMDTDMARKHYGEHEGKSFFDNLVAFITSGPVVAMVVQGESAVSRIRSMMGKTDPGTSAPGTIRGDLGQLMSRNVIHGSDSSDSARREISLFFREEDLIEYSRADEIWLYE